MPYFIKFIGVSTICDYWYRLIV